MLLRAAELVDVGVAAIYLTKWWVLLLLLVGLVEGWYMILLRCKTSCIDLHCALGVSPYCDS